MDNQANMESSWAQEFYRNLTTLVDADFPKRCPNCGKFYADSHAFLTETTPVKDMSFHDRSGLFSLAGMRPVAAISVFRNCICGSTMMADFHDRRDLSEKGMQRRAHFDAVIQTLCNHGIQDEEARTELRKVLRGEDSTKLVQWLREDPHAGISLQSTF